MNELQLLEKADTTINEFLDDGGMMPPETAERFRVKIMNEPTMLREVRRVPMSRNEMRLPTLASNGRMLRAARNMYSSNDDSVGVEAGYGAPYRALEKNERSKVKAGMVIIKTDEVIAQLNLTYEMLEDVIQGGSIDNTQFEELVLDLIAQQTALDLEEKLVLGDTTNGGDPFLAQQDGIVRMATENVVDHNGNPINPHVFSNLLSALPSQYQRLIPNMRFYVHYTVERAYRMAIAQRQTALGDSTLVGTAPVYILGVQVVPVWSIPANTIILTDPRNIMFGIQRDFTLETDRDRENRLIKLIVTMRVGQQVEEKEMLAKAINISL